MFRASGHGRAGSRNAAYAQESVKLMDAWSATVTTHTDSNVRRPNEPRSATMPRTVYLPEVRGGSTSKATGNCP